LGVMAWDLGLRGLLYRIQDLGLRGSGLGGLRFGIRGWGWGWGWGWGLGGNGLGFGVQGSGFRDSGFEFRFEGS